MGAAEGDPDHEFYQVRGAVRQSDGTIVVANAGSHQLRFYGPDGSLKTAVGRQGAGPGEFEMLGTLQKLAEDSLLTLDIRHRRMSVFTPTGGHVRDIPLQGANPFLFLMLVGPLGDGTYLTSAPTVRMGPELFSRPLGLARDSLQLLRVDSTGATIDTFGVFPTLQVNVKNIEMGGRSMPMGLPVAFSSQTSAASGTGVAFVGTSDTYQIGVYGPAGELRRLIRKTHQPRPVTEADRQRYRDLMRNRPMMPGMTGQLRQLNEQMNAILADPDFAETMPAFGRLAVDALGNLWVADPQVSPEDPLTWTVFDAGGRLLGAIVTPARFVVTEIGADYVLGHLTDETETQHVLMYRLIKPQA